MDKNNPDEFNAKTLEDIEITTTAKLVRHGNQIHISLRIVDVEFWGLKQKDRVLFSIKKVKRYKP